jgi:hypothetical protein
MMRKFININQFFLVYILISLSFISSQHSSIDNCSFSKIDLENITITQFSDDILIKIIILNLPNLFNNSILFLFEEEYQMFLFRNSFCTNEFINYKKLQEYNFENKLHLFSIEGDVETNHNIIKLVIQTKTEFQILYFENSKRIDNEINQEIFNIKTNLYPYFMKKIFYNEEYEFFIEKNINIFNDEEQMFNDICYLYEELNITKPPILRRSLYYFKNDILTYPLLNSSNNCLINNNNISYENESFILEYICKRNFNISVKDINIKLISIINKKEIETYSGPNSLKDQKELLKCHKESFKVKYIKNNIGFYISLFLIFIVFISIIILIIQKYEYKQEEDILLEAPPKKKTLKEAIKEQKDKKNVNFGEVEIIKEKKKKKKKRKRKK